MPIDFTGMNPAWKGVGGLSDHAEVSYDADGIKIFSNNVTKQCKALLDVNGNITDFNNGFGITESDAEYQARSAAQINIIVENIGEKKSDFYCLQEVNNLDRAVLTAHFNSLGYGIILSDAANPKAVATIYDARKYTHIPDAANPAGGIFDHNGEKTALQSAFSINAKPGEKVTIINVHADFKDNSVGAEVKKVIDQNRLDNPGSKLMFIGDWNRAPEHSSIQGLKPVGDPDRATSVTYKPTAQKSFLTEDSKRYSGKEDVVRRLDFIIHDGCSSVKEYSGKQFGKKGDEVVVKNYRSSLKQFLNKNTLDKLYSKEDAKKVESSIVEWFEGEDYDLQKRKELGGILNLRKGLVEERRRRELLDSAGERYVGLPESLEIGSGGARGADKLDRELLVCDKQLESFFQSGAKLSVEEERKVREDAKKSTSDQKFEALPKKILDHVIGPKNHRKSGYYTDYADKRRQLFSKLLHKMGHSVFKIENELNSILKDSDGLLNKDQFEEMQKLISKYLAKEDETRQKALEVLDKKIKELDTKLLKDVEGIDGKEIELRNAHFIQLFLLLTPFGLFASLGGVIGIPLHYPTIVGDILDILFGDSSFIDKITSIIEKPIEMLDNFIEQAVGVDTIGHTSYLIDQFGYLLKEIPILSEIMDIPNVVLNNDIVQSLYHGFVRDIISSELGPLFIAYVYTLEGIADEVEHKPGEILEKHKKSLESAFKPSGDLDKVSLKTVIEFSSKKLEITKRFHLELKFLLSLAEMPDDLLDKVSDGVEFVETVGGKKRKLSDIRRDAGPDQENMVCKLRDIFKLADNEDSHKKVKNRSYLFEAVSEENEDESVATIRTRFSKEVSEYENEKKRLTDLKNNSSGNAEIVKKIDGRLKDLEDVLCRGKDAAELKFLSSKGCKYGIIKPEFYESESYDARQKKVNNFEHDIATAMAKEVMGQSGQRKGDHPPTRISCKPDVKKLVQTLHQSSLAV